MRIRITFSKQGALRYTGHLDLHKLWERAARRADIPLAYTQGFHPTPRIQIASALPLGFSSRCEVADFFLSADLDVATLSSKLQPALPSGLSVLNVESVDERSPALQTQLIAADYEVTLLEQADASNLDLRLAALTDAPTLPRVKRDKAYDLRPQIEELSLMAGAEKKIHMRLASRAGDTGRPEEVLAELNLAIEDVQVERTRLVFKDS